MTFYCGWCGKKSVGQPPGENGSKRLALLFPFDTMHCAAIFGIECAAEMATGGRIVKLRYDPYTGAKE